MNLFLGNNNHEVTSAPTQPFPEPAAEVVQESAAGAVQGEMSEPAPFPEPPTEAGQTVPGPTIEIPIQRPEGGARETATQVPAGDRAGPSTAPEPAGEVPEEGELFEEGATAEQPQKRGQKKKNNNNAVRFSSDSKKGYFFWPHIELGRERMPGFEGRKGHTTAVSQSSRNKTSSSSGFMAWSTEFGNKKS